MRGQTAIRTLTIRIPEGKHERLRNLAKARGVSLNRLIDELATVALAEYDSETRFRAMAARGSRQTGLALLEKLDLEKLDLEKLDRAFS